MLHKMTLYLVSAPNSGSETSSHFKEVMKAALLSLKRYYLGCWKADLIESNLKSLVRDSHSVSEKSLMGSTGKATRLQGQ